MSRLDHLVILDLATHRLVGRALAAAARRHLRGASTALLLSDPQSRAAGTDWGSRVLPPSQYVPPEARAAAHEWTHAVSATILSRASRLFPELPGADLGALALVGLQTYLDDYALLAAAAREAHREHQVGQTWLYTSDRSAAAALASVIPGPTRRRVVGRPKAVARLLALRTGHPGNPSAEQILGGPRLIDAAAARGSHPRLLVVVESRPMAQMFGALEAHFDRLALSPRWYVDYSGNRPVASFEVHDDRTVLHLGRPDQVAPERPWRFLSALAGALEAARELESSPGSAWLGGGLPLAYWLENLYLGELAIIADQAERARRIVDAVQPELVLVGNDRWWLGQSFVQAARARGIPTLWVQDGTAVDAPFYYWMTADRLAAASDWLPETLARHGTSPERMRVTGQPRYDALVALARASSRQAVRQRLGLRQDARYALVATQPLQSSAYAREVIEALLQVPDLLVLLRPHPSQDHAPLAAVAASFPSDRVSFHPRDSVFDLLVACDLMVNQFSTVTIEAAIVGRPVITANFSGLPDPAPYARFGLSTAAHLPAEVTAVAAEMLAAGGVGFGASPDGLRLLVGPTDGQAGARVADMIVELMARRGC